MHDVAVTTRVRLARNYEDIPFRGRFSPAQAEACIDRTLAAMRATGEPYRLVRMGECPQELRQSLVESHLISRDLLSADPPGAALIRMDDVVSILMNEEDHLRIQAIYPGEQLARAAQTACAAEGALSERVRFAFDEQLGYLTACPTNTGTGMRASVMLHLPMLTALKQMGKVSQLAAKLGLTIRGIYGEGSEALGNLYQLSNQVTLGRTENEIVEAVQAVARQMADLERKLRAKALEKDAVALDDQLFRALGMLQNARRMSAKEFMAHWSGLRLGAAMGRLPVRVEDADRLLTLAQDAHVRAQAEQDLDERALDIARSEKIRTFLSGGNHGDFRTV